MPDFLQFADECATRAKMSRESPSGWALALTNFEQQMQEAERHARLLAAVSEWANSITEDLEDTEFHSGLEAGECQAKGHVRALLAQTEEK